MWGVDLMLEAPRTARATGASKRSLSWDFVLGQQQGVARRDGGAFVGPCLIGARSTACVNAQAFPTGGANCKDSICNDPKLVLGSHV